MDSEKKKLLTLCTAAYNAENCIEAMLLSVIAAGRQEEIELLIVNDGSKDRTEEIIQEYKNQYPDMIRYIFKENGGAGSAWNIGMREASGRYFKLLDADDCVDSNGLGRLVDILKDEKADLILTDYTKVYPEKRLSVDFKSTVRPATGRDVSYFQKLKFTMHAVTFRTEILCKHEMRLTEKVPYTDFQFIMFPIPFVNLVSYYDINVYMYSLGVEGQSVSDEVLLGHLDALAGVISTVTDYYVDCLKKGLLSESQKSWMLYSVIGEYRDMMKLYLRNEKKGNWLKVKAFDKRIGLADKTLEAASGKYGVIKIIRGSDYRLCMVIAVWYRLKYRLYQMLKGLQKH